jgi:phosphate transport system protein
MRKQFLDQLKNLRSEIINLYDLVHRNVELLKICLEDDNLEKQKNDSYERDQKIRKKGMEIEKICIELLSLQHPVAKDLRLIVTALKFLNDFQRISRNSLHILEELVEIHPIKSEKYRRVLRQLIETIEFMLQEIYTSIVSNTPSSSDVLIESDNVIDLRYEELSSILHEDLEKKNISWKQAMAFIKIARFFERIGDHICNIGERWFYTESGERTIIK